MRGNLQNIHSGYLMFIVLVGPVILVAPAEGNSKECEEVSTDECLKKLQTFLKLTSLPFTSSEAELDTLCSNAVAGYNCSAKKASISNCLSPDEKSLFPVFVDMAQYTVFMLCKSEDGKRGYLRDGLLKNSECILKQKRAFNCCAEQTKLPDLPIMNILDQSGKSLADRQISACCPVSRYLRCVQDVLQKSCGELAGNITTEYIRRASGEEMEEVCQKMPNYPYLDEGMCKMPVPVCSGSTSGAFLELTTLMGLLLIMWIFYS